MSEPIWWKSLGERDRDPALLAAAAQEFPETPLSNPDARVDRRGLMKGFAAVFAGATLSGCTRGVVHKAIPLLVQPEQLTPGRATWYATTCAGCTAGCGALVKVRDGRPIKLEGNPEHPLSKGGLCAVGQAQVLSLYDPTRLSGPRSQGKKVSWKDADEEIARALETIKSQGGVRILTGTIASATVQSGMDALIGKFPGAKHVSYDGLSVAAILDAHARTHGKRVLPRYRFDRASAVVSFDADFLGTWIAPVEHTALWRESRKLEGERSQRSWLCQLEARLSLTGSNADRRFRVAPHDVGPALAHVVARLLSRAGIDKDLGKLGESPLPKAAVEEIAEKLWHARGAALVVSGVNDVDVQALVNLANDVLGAYGSIVELDAPSRQKTGDDRAVRELLAELEAGKVSALLVHGVNPVYDLPEGARFAAALAKAPLTVAYATHLDETARACRLVLPVPHFLEAWDASEPVDGVLATTQPTIAPLGDVRSFAESLARLVGDGRSDLELVKASLERLLPRQKKHASAQALLDHALHAGFVPLQPAAPRKTLAMDRSTIGKAFARKSLDAGQLAACVYAKVAILEGRHAGNPWLQEMPDPISKAVWDNYACLSPATAQRLEVKDGDRVRVKWGKDESLELPALVQPGQHDGTVAIALGYGRAGTERFATVGPSWLEARPTTDGGPVGVRAAGLLAFANGTTQYGALAVTLEKTGKRSDLARTQDHHSLHVPEKLAPRGGEVRPHVRTLPLAALGSSGEEKKAEHGEKTEHGEKNEHDLWPDDFATKGPRWALSIDLDACTGCGACVVSCQAENNVPVVGKDEVRRHREMHWIRIDRYYSGDGDETKVAHQPMTCQHCANAPCETVCPVLATVHSKEGLNQQVYNRCVGTRYCANNCPYKVRRFNWFDYAHDDAKENLVLNPDVTVRSRGVMEKCSLCVQRIQEARFEARRKGIPVADGAIKTACQQSCPAQAIRFGDASDPKSAVSQAIADRRHYRVLDELNVKPAVGYLAKVANPEGSRGA